MIANLLRSLKDGKPCTEQNPWGGGRTLEWFVPSPPPLENFRDVPVVNRGPYDLEPGQEHK
jgi:cytochrome c oxidase subunit 1